MYFVVFALGRGRKPALPLKLSALKSSNYDADDDPIVPKRAASRPQRRPLLGTVC